ncbi:MAG: TIGR02996 domain-containing protein [Fimbriiglobus sp.]
MTEDSLFLKAIVANPDYQLCRLAYADWLDERDDPRGELIRLEEETRDRVAWDDTLWRLKPRRNELRKQVDAKWLKVMGYDQTSEPLFRGQAFPSNVREAWRLIREAHERWNGDPMPDVGGHRDKVAEAERRLGLTLPPSVQEYIAFAHDLPQSGEFSPESREVYREFYSMEAVPGQPALSILELFEGDWRWGIPLDLLQQEGPPVQTYDMQPHADGSYENALFAPVRDRPLVPLTEFIFWQVHRYADESSGYAGEMSVNVEDIEQTQSLLREQFSYHSEIGGRTYYETSNLSAWLRIPGYHSAGRVEVRPFRPITEEQMPECVREWFRSGAPCNGHFGDLRAAQRRRSKKRKRPEVG